MKIQYMIAKESSTEELCEAVEARIKEGWEPQGGVSVANSSKVIFTQALILKTE